MADLSAFVDGPTEAPKNANDLQLARAIIRNNIAFGIDCKRFLESGLGRYLETKAAEEVDVLVQTLIETPAHDAHNISTLQNGIEARREWLRWISEAIEAGGSALLNHDRLGHEDDNPEVKHD